MIASPTLLGSSLCMQAPPPRQGHSSDGQCLLPAAATRLHRHQLPCHRLELHQQSPGINSFFNPSATPSWLLRPSHPDAATRTPPRLSVDNCCSDFLLRRSLLIEQIRPLALDLPSLPPDRDPLAGHVNADLCSVLLPSQLQLLRPRRRGLLPDDPPLSSLCGCSCVYVCARGDIWVRSLGVRG